ncbi:cyclopropane-fatty-acyl-phospholipid synthase [Actinoplanes sp. SE50]|uniref:class I SAM-dependent methyltransferase n=1 Tax=unclassified Actinoplanes TaxID=2626549 RepID=UPI00023ED267|nr:MULTISPECIES: class I SAM-dependent methyltransferase [unclassified Actinoplanes]AEV85559.1 cyclopropane-fatty-acyl-phospholipid synthase [Actinoplanes sp. SE50/110]ATO83952.1 cyclopropane-fatty-acyl-phospholipid synthase [Actinoplanes sp. SE50]SLM01362.1 cyclopropane-fatty-acyl-phospholipid synthase [Actinoplanes sp. SE50/110]
MRRRSLADVFSRRYDEFFRDRTPIPFEILTRDGATLAYGAGGSTPAEFRIVVRDDTGHDALASLDQLQVALAYLRGDIDIEGDLAAALTMRRFFSDIHPVAFVGRWAPSLWHGKAGHDRRAISQHYDEESDFFLTFLDERHRCYTQGVFHGDDEPLEDAVTRKLDIALDDIGVKPGDRVLEVGGGWGAFSEHAARRGIDVTTVTLAVESERFLKDLFERERLPVTVVREHILQFRSDQRYDAIVNMGVTEHLPDYGATLKTYARLLKPGGRVYLDALAMRRKHTASTFFKQYVYPGRSAPLLLHQYLQQVARSPFDLLSVQDDRHNYYLTCREWAKRLDARREEIVARWGEELYRRFRIFLWGSASGFDTRLVQAYRWTLQYNPSATA